MIRQWLSFQRENEDIRIFLDRGVKERVEFASYPTLVNLSLNIYHIAEKKEQVIQIQEELIGLQERLDECHAQTSQGLFIGRIDSETRIELIFYVTDSQTSKEIIHECLNQFPRFRYTISTRPDEEWGFYDYLSPNYLELEYCTNNNAIHSFYNDGYKTDVEYTVHYYLRFPSREQLHEADTSLSSQGYRVENIEFDSEGLNYKHVLHVSVACLLNEDDLNKNTKLLVDTAHKWDGRYIGWGIYPKERPIRKLKAAFKKLKYYVWCACFILLIAAIGMYFMDGRPSRMEKLSGSGDVKNIEKTLEPGQRIPEIKLRDDKGATVELGKPTRPQVISFCDVIFEPCQRDYMQLQELAKEFQDRIDFVAIRFLPGTPDFLTEHPSLFPILLDERREAYTRYQVKQFPLTYFINSEGIIIEVFGPKSSLTLEKMKELSQKLH